MENTHRKGVDEEKKIHKHKPPNTTHKTLAGHMLGNITLEHVDNLVVEQIGINSTLHQELCSNSLQQCSQFN